MKPEIFNTDQGSQYTSELFSSFILDQGIRLSMDGRGRATDNAFIERLWRSVKYEKLYLHEYETGKELYDLLDDYRPIGLDGIGGSSTLSPMDATLPPDYELFNGNIVRHYQSTIADGFRTAGLVGEYDQLNRLRFGTNAFYGSRVPAGRSLSEALEAPTYDGNGNIRTLDRSYASTREQRHRNRLAYTYAPGTNRLVSVDADVHGAAINEDWLPFDLLRGRTEYAYDKSGNLIKETNDGQAGETRIDWNPYGKVTTVTSPTGTTTFGYGPDQNRWVKDRGERGATYYVRDAQGSTLATYEGGSAGAKLTWKQQYLFGSSRLGEVVFDRPIEPTTANPFNYGERRYELTNHLGNVTTVFGENAMAYTDTEDGTTYTAPALVSYRDYLAFGLGLERSSVGAGLEAYRFGFNGKEKDDEGEWGTGQTNYDFGERVYSPTVGRYMSVDPFARSRTWTTPYNFVQNNPINRIDPTGGLDTIFYNRQGAETGRIRTTTGRHVYLLAHEEGTKQIHGQRYYQGNSYWSFFGDPARNSNELFEAVDTETFPSLSPDVVNGLVNIQYDGEGFVRTWYNSGPGGQFDFKNNRAIFGDNEKTAYLIDDVLYNRNEMGMFLWGGAMGKTGVKYSRLVQWNGYFHSKIEGNADEWNEVFTWTTGFYITKYGSKNTSSIEKLLYFERWSSAPGYNLPSFSNPALRGGDPTSNVPSFETETRRPNKKSTGLMTVFENVLQVTTGIGTGPSDETILNQEE